MLDLDEIEPNNTETNTWSLTIVRLPMWEGQVFQRRQEGPWPVTAKQFEMHQQKLEKT